MVASFFKVSGLRMAVFKVGRVEKYPAVRNRSSKVAIVEIALMRIGVIFVAVFAVVFVALLYIVWKCIAIWLFFLCYSMRINEDLWKYTIFLMINEQRRALQVYMIHHMHCSSLFNIFDSSVSTNL